MHYTSIIYYPDMCLTMQIIYEVDFVQLDDTAVLSVYIRWR